MSAGRADPPQDAGIRFELLHGSGLNRRRWGRTSQSVPVLLAFTDLYRPNTDAVQIGGTGLGQELDLGQAIATRLGAIKSRHWLPSLGTIMTECCVLAPRTFCLSMCSRRDHGSAPGHELEQPLAGNQHGGLACQPLRAHRHEAVVADVECLLVETGLHEPGSDLGCQIWWTAMPRPEDQRAGRAQAG